jgi:hypothetical protein
MQRKNPMPGSYAGVQSRVDSNTFTMGNPMLESTLTLRQSRPYPPDKDFGFALRAFALISRITEHADADNSQYSFFVQYVHCIYCTTYR